MFLLAAASSIAGYAANATFFYHTLRQLRLIAGIHRWVGSIDLLYLEPLHAFAGVTAWTGVVLLTLGYLAVPTTPFALSNPALVASAIALMALAVASFVVPLNGIHDLIVVEKSRRLEASSRLLERALRDLHDRVEGRDLVHADGLNQQISGLLAEREVILKTPTWPWASETIRGFATALVLPIVLWLALRILERTVV